MQLGAKAEARRVFRNKISKTLDCFNIYGQGVFIAECMQAAIEAAEELHRSLCDAENLDRKEDA